MAARRRWPYVILGIVGVIVIAIAVVLWRLDAILLKTAREQAATYSEKLGRPITIGDISTRLFPSVGAKVKDVTVGAAQGEEAPLAQVPQVNVSVAAWPLLTSRGKDIQVEDASVTGLVINVIKFPDGTTNVQRLQERLAQTQPQQPQPPPDQNAPPRDLSGVRVDRAAIENASIHFIDHSAGAGRQLSVNALDVVVKDLRVGQPLMVKLDAAVLAQQQNLHAQLQAAPLPSTLVPTPVSISLQADKVDLAPLGPFLPPSVGLQSGTLDANWKADLGAAVPGGEGPTKVVGTVKALGMKFTGSQGGKPLDVVLDTDVSADTAKGDLGLKKLMLAFGPASITGQGEVKGLLTQSPAVQNFQLVSHDLDPAVLAQYYPPLRKQLKGMIAGPIGLSITGGGTQAAQALNAVIDLTATELHIPQQLAKARNAPMKLTARITGAAASGGALRFASQADLTGADLRPGLSLNKGPGQKLTVAASGTYQPARGAQPMKVDVPSLTVQALDDTLNGSATASLQGQGTAKQTNFAVTLKSPHLDADKLLMTPEQQMAENGGKLPPPPTDPHRFDGLNGTIHAELGLVRYQQMDLKNLVADLKMVNDRFSVEKLSVGVYGGTVVADGTWINLGPLPEKRPFAAKIQAKNVDVSQALAARTPKKVLTGAFNGNVDLKGTGYTPDSLKQSLLGAINGNLLNGQFLGTDLVTAVTGPLAKALPFASKALASDATTSLGDKLPFGVHIQNGVAQLDKPISWTRPQAAMSLDGGIRLDGTLDLGGSVNLTPATIKTLTVGKVTPSAPVPVALRLGGKAWSPQVVSVDVKPAAAQIAKQAAAGLATQLLGDKAKPVTNIINGGSDAAKAQAAEKQKQLEAQAAQEKAKAQAAAKAQADAAKKRAEEEAAKKLKGLFGH